MKFNIVVEGREDAVEFVRSRLHLFDAGLERALNFAAINLAAIAARKAPKDTGALRGSMRHYLVNRNARIVGLVRMGRGVKYARYVEFGTVTSRPRKPPPASAGSALASWAARHGLNPWKVAARIGNRWTVPVPGKIANVRKTYSGVPPSPFAYDAWQEAMPFVFNAVEQVTRAVYG